VLSEGTVWELQQPVTIGGALVTRPAYLEMDRGVHELEINELAKPGITTVETALGQQRLDANPGLTPRIDIKHDRVAVVLQVSEGIIADLPGGGLLVRCLDILDR